MSVPSPRTARWFAPLLVAVGLTGPTPAADPLVWHDDYATARRAAERQNLPLLVVIGTEQCVYCRKLEGSLADAGVRDFASGKFVPLKVDANREPEFARAMRVNVYPTTVIAGPDGKIYAYLAGFLTPDQFTEHAKKALALIPAPATHTAEKTATTTSLTKVPTPPADSIAAAPVKAVGPTDGTKPLFPAADLLTAARAAYKAERFAECYGLCDTITSGYPGTAEAESALSILASLKADPDKLAAAADQADERAAATYYDLAEAWATQGRARFAIAYYEKAVKAAPNGRHAGAAQAKLVILYRDYPALRASK